MHAQTYQQVSLNYPCVPVRHNPCQMELQHTPGTRDILAWSVTVAFQVYKTLTELIRSWIFQGLIKPIMNNHSPLHLQRQTYRYEGWSCQHWETQRYLEKKERLSKNLLSKNLLLLPNATRCVFVKTI
jgi:hypothetical protein